MTNWANGLWTPRDKQVEKLVAGMHRTMAALYIYIYSQPYTRLPAPNMCGPRCRSRILLERRSLCAARTHLGVGMAGMAVRLNLKWSRRGRSDSPVCILCAYIYTDPVRAPGLGPGAPGFGPGRPNRCKSWFAGGWLRPLKNQPH